MALPSLWDTVSVGLVALYGYPWLAFLQTGDHAYIVLGVCILLVDMTTKVLKQLACDMDTDPGAATHWSRRPIGATNCDILCRNGDCVGAPGMPSGHAASAAFFFTFCFIVFMKRSPLRGLYAAAATGAVTLTCAARVIKRCHTLEQVVAGTLWGGACALIVTKLLFR